MSIYNHGVTGSETAGNWMLDVAMVLYGVWKMRLRRLGGAHCSAPISRPTRTRITGLLQEMLVPGAIYPQNQAIHECHDDPAVLVKPPPHRDLLVLTLGCNSAANTAMANVLSLDCYYFSPSGLGR